MKISARWLQRAIALVALTFVASCAASEVRDSDTVLVRFAVLGDAEPKPEPLFPGVEAAVRDVNALAKNARIDFVVGVGDLAHDGTVIQYENVTPILQQLNRPFYPIMGNEEHTESVERYLDYARRWNPAITSTRYVQNHGPLVLVYASPDFGRDFNDDGIAWMLDQVSAAAPTPVFLVVHAAQAGVYPESADKGVHHPGFLDIVAQPNLAAVISGDLHMDMDRAVHSKQIGHVHYLHMPALERTKIPDETHHQPMFRVFTIFESGNVRVDTYETGQSEPLQRHAYSFVLATCQTCD